jgi:predicted protein tyrosine phosphatase
MKVYGFSRVEFIEYLTINSITDATVENFKEEFFISILSSGGPMAEPVFSQLHSNVLTIQFDDVDADISKWGQDVGHMVEAKVITESHALTLIKFIDSIPSFARINIHCVYGISRTGALAKFLEEYRGAEIYCKQLDNLNGKVFSLLKSVAKLR